MEIDLGISIEMVIYVMKSFRDSKYCKKRREECLGQNSEVELLRNVQRKKSPQRCEGMAREVGKRKARVVFCHGS